MWPLLIQDSPSPSLPSHHSTIISSAPASAGQQDNYPHFLGFNSPLLYLWPPLRQTLTSQAALPANGGVCACVCMCVLSCWEVWFRYNADHKEKNTTHTKNN